MYTIHSPTTMEMEIEWAGEGLGRRIRRWFGQPLLKRMEQRCLERSAVIASDSDFTRRQIKRIHGAELGNRIQVIPGWVDLERFKIVPDRTAAKQALGWPLDVPVLFTLRRLVRRMGLDRLVRAVGILRQRGHKLHLIIGGAGPRDANLKSWCKRSTSATPSGSWGAWLTPTFPQCTPPVMRLCCPRLNSNVSA